jgi:dynein intermediate chain 1
LFFFLIDDFLKQTPGMFLIYSLKNPSFPENIFQTESGVMSLDFHPNHPHLLCCGKFYDLIYISNKKKIFFQVFMMVQ